jgi:CRISPR-associated protein Cmr5
MMENQRLKTEKSRAETAFNYAKDGLEKHGEKYETIIRKLSMQIKTNGIGATIAFHFSKSETKNGVNNAHKYVLNQLRGWLNDFVTANTVEEFSLNIVKLSPAETRATTNEALALLNWLRRFTDGLSSNMPKTVNQDEEKARDA